MLGHFAECDVSLTMPAGTSLHGIVPCSSNPSRLAIRLSDNVVRMVSCAYT